ncbi:MAG: DivIVA domain-containing protein [Rubrobacteraceae bacterium]
MKPIDVRRKEFKNSMRGYNADQVDDFLDSVADEYERSYSENLRLREEVSSLRERLEQFEKLEDSIQSALVHAESAANDLRESATTEAENLRNNASREADLITKQADERAQKMLTDASSKVERAQESYEALKQAKHDFAADFRHLLKAYIAVMDNVDLVSAPEIEASLRERLDWEARAAARKAAGEQGPEESTGENRTTVEPSEPEAEGEADPEVEEPEVEPSSVEDEGQQAVAQNSEAAGEVEQEESSPIEKGASDGEQEDNGASPEDADDEQATRASRFLRRRG